MKTFLYLASLTLLLNLTSCATRVKTRPINNKATIVKVAPRGHKVIYVKGKRYYKWNGKHYKKTRRGFVVTRI